MEATLSKTGFFDLPVELRYQIYDLVCHFDIDHCIVQDIEHSAGSKGTHATLIPSEGTSLIRSVSWINLALTCRNIARELQEFMSAVQFLADDVNRTYVLDLDVYSRRSTPTTRQVLMRQLPCPPDSVQTLVINVSAREGNSPWTEGGPASLARAVYQILNHICHNGPRLVRSKPLGSHMRIRDLIVNVDIGKISKPPKPGCNVDPRWDYALLLKGFQQIAGMGYLFGYVANIHVRGNGEYAEQAYMVDSCGVQSVPGAWENYGFSWGV